MKTLRLYDFDGTLTRADSMLAFVAHCFGRGRLIMGLALFSPIILLMKAGLVKSHYVKEHFLSHYLKGMSEDEFLSLCQTFAQTKRHLLRPKAIDELRQAEARGDRLVVVSASLRAWVEPLFRGHNIMVIGTEAEVRDGRLTGRLATRNCRGPEKVARLRERLPEVFGSEASRREWHVVAYGDSKGDREMLSAADECHWKPFR